MRKNIYAVIDNKANDTVGRVLEVQTHNINSIRNFQEAFQTEGSIFAKHPEDFDLWCLGYIDPTTLALVPDKQLIITGTSMAAMLTPIPQTEPNLKLAGGK